MASPSARTFISRSGVSMRPAGTSRCSRSMALVHVLDGQALGLEPRGVEPDADVALAVAADEDLAHALDRLELRA